MSYIQQSVVFKHNKMHYMCQNEKNMQIERVAISMLQWNYAILDMCGHQNIPQNQYRL